MLYRCVVLGMPHTLCRNYKNFGGGIYSPHIWSQRSKKNSCTAADIVVYVCVHAHALVCAWKHVSSTFINSGISITWFGDWCNTRHHWTIFCFFFFLSFFSFSPWSYSLSSTLVIFIEIEHVRGSRVFPYIFFVQKVTAQNVDMTSNVLQFHHHLSTTSFHTGSRSWEWLSSLFCNCCVLDSLSLPLEICITGTVMWCRSLVTQFHIICTITFL